MPVTGARRDNTVRFPELRVRESLEPHPSLPRRCVIVQYPGTRAPNRLRVPSLRMESSVLDIVYVLGVIAVFAPVGLVAWGVEKL